MQMSPSIRMIQRVAVGTLAMFLFLFLALVSHHAVGSWFFLIALASAVGVALREYYEMAVERGYGPYIRTGLWTAMAYLGAIFLSLWYDGFYSLYAFVFFAGVLSFFFQNYQQPQDNLIANAAITLFGFAYIAVSLSSLLFITYFPFQETLQDGRWWMIYVVVVTKMTDIGAYFFGKWRGKTPLAPQISPKKSVEGAIGGLALALATAIFMPLFLPNALNISLSESVIFGLCLGTIGQIGDLIESLFKRDAGVKDSSSLPGLGGILDIFDSLIFNIPIAYFLIKGFAF